MQRRMSVDWQDWLDMGPDGPVRWIVYCIGKCSGQKYKNPSAPLKWEKEIVVLLVFWKSFVSIKKKTWRKLLILLSKFLCSSHQKMRTHATLHIWTWKADYQIKSLQICSVPLRSVRPALKNDTRETHSYEEHKWPWWGEQRQSVWQESGS